MATEDPEAKLKPKPKRKRKLNEETDEAVSVFESDPPDETESSTGFIRKPVGSIVIVPPRGRKARTIYL